MKFGDAVIYNIGGVDHNALVQVVNQDGSLHLAYFAPERENPVASKRIGYLPAIIYDYDVPEAKVGGWRIPVAKVEYSPRLINVDGDSLPRGRELVAIDGGDMGRGAEQGHVEFHADPADAIAKLPSAEDLDKVAEEDKAKAATGKRKFPKL